jgi:hypothetical protein
MSVVKTVVMVMLLRKFGNYGIAFATSDFSDILKGKSSTLNYIPQWSISVCYH